jgi:endonuclease/exonuclease/phosphatase family metal-dependent hydrolase
LAPKRPNGVFTIHYVFILTKRRRHAGLAAYWIVVVLFSVRFADVEAVKGINTFIGRVGGDGSSNGLIQARSTPPAGSTVGRNGKTAPAVFRPSTGTWYILDSSTVHVYQWGVSTDVPVPGDYDGDGKTDVVVYRPSTGQWFVLTSSSDYMAYTVVSWGVSTDVPLQGDYDGDGMADPAVYRPTTGQWLVLKSSTNYTTNLAVSWGVSADVPLQGDYDGDGKADPAVFRPSTGVWYFLKSSTAYTTSGAVSWGLSTDVPVPGDYDGDGKSDPAVYRPSTGQWLILNSSTDYATSGAASWGVSTDTLVPGDYDGDGKADPAVYRPSTGQWFILKSSTSYTSWDSYQWGASTDIPVNMTIVPKPAGGTPVVVTWNIENIYSESHARAAMDYLTALDPAPEVIVIQEAYQEHFAAFVDELQRRTGRTWYGAFSTHCPPGGWNGSMCTISSSEGVGIFSTYPIAQSSATFFPFPDCWTSARTGLRAALDVAGMTLQVFALHLQTGGCSDVMQARYNSMASFKQWASQYSTPQVVGGDFNADPDQIVTPAGMSGNFVDSWAIVGTGRGLTSFTPVPTMKLDYLFADSSGKAQPQWSTVVTSPGTFSDHYPVAAAFVIRP